MPKLRRLSGAEVVAIFARFGFSVASQRGSHVKLKRATAGGTQTLTVPAHREIDTGTLRAIVRQAARFIPEGDLRPHFYEAADQIHEPSEAERGSSPASRILQLPWDTLLPAEWSQTPDAAVWLTCFQCVGVSEADLALGWRCIDLGAARAVILYEQLPHFSPGELVIQSREHATYRFRPEIVETPRGAYVLITSPLGQADPDARLRARSRVDAAAGLLAAIAGRNVVYRRVFERVEWLNPPKWEDSGPFVRNPATLPRPDITNERLALCATAAQRASSLDVTSRDRVLLSLRWFAQAFESSGVDGFLKYWIALEALGMSDANSIRPLNDALGQAYGIPSREAATRYEVGQIFGFRSLVMHRGATPSIHASLLDYLEALYRDVLFKRLSLKCEAAAEAIRKQPGFDLRALFGQS